jgi:hypothetical protein
LSRKQRLGASSSSKVNIQEMAIKNISAKSKTLLLVLFNTNINVTDIDK